jgi:hypothetical protein
MVLLTEKIGKIDFNQLVKNIINRKSAPKQAPEQTDN